MSEFSLTLVLQFKTSKIIYDMANIIIKSQKITPFGGIFHVMEKFDRYIGPVVDGELGLRCTTFGYQYSEITRSLMSVYFCGGDCVEDVTSHLMPSLAPSHPPHLLLGHHSSRHQGTEHHQHDLHLRDGTQLRLQYSSEIEQASREDTREHRPTLGGQILRP